MGVEQKANGEPRPTTKEFFDTPGETGVSNLSAFWMRNANRSEIFEGKPKILALHTKTGVDYYRFEEVILYDDNETQERWSRPGSRGDQLVAAGPGEIIGYTYRVAGVIPFIKTRTGTAENIQIAKARKVDNNGDPLPGDESVIRAGEISRKIGLEHTKHAQLTPILYKGKEGFLLSTGLLPISQEDLDRAEDLLND